LIIDCVSDLHGIYPLLEGGDLLILAGDYTRSDRTFEWEMFFQWLDSQKYKKKVFIAGNHDNLLHSCCCSYEAPDGTYLCDCGTEFEGLKIWGSPWTTAFEGMNPCCKAFTVQNDAQLSEKWSLIPDDTDILITHSPAYGMMDLCVNGDKMDCVGSKSLLKWKADHYNTLKLHVFGHVHEGYGVWDQRKIQKETNGKPGPIYVNAAHLDRYYRPRNKPIRIVL